jgi:nicotinamidase-related amidase
MTTALILIDAQRNMLEGDQPVPGAEEIRNALAVLLDSARAAGCPVVHVQNDGPPGEVDEPGTEGWELVFPVHDGEVCVRKDVMNAFAANPDLAPELRQRGVDRVVIAGMQSDFCVRATGLGALGLGFGVVLPHGAHATYDGGSTAAADVSAEVERELAEAGAQVTPLSEVTFGTS